MANFPHRIRRQRWAAHAGSAVAAFTLRQRLHDFWQSALLPAFEEAFDQEAPGEEVIHLTRIELTLRVELEEKLGAQWPGLLHEQLVRQLQETLRARRGAQDKGTEWKQSTAEENRFQTLLRYLRSGSVSWEAAGLSASELAAELKETCREGWRRLATLLQAGPAPPFEYCFRLLQLLPAAETSAAVRAILGNGSLAWEISLPEIVAALLAPEQKQFGRYTQLRLAALFLSEALAAQRNNIVPDFVRIARQAGPFESAGPDHFMALLPSPAGASSTADSISKAEAAVTKEIGLRMEESSPATSPEIPGGLQKKKTPERGSRMVPDRVRNTGRVAPSEGEASRPKPAGTGKTAASTSRKGAAAEENRSPTGNARPPSSPEIPGASETTPPPPFKSATEVDFPLLVAHAGLVLLHPFLPRFFESTGTSEKTGGELSASALPRAAALLHFLATGRDAIHEYDLAFIKVLLGVDLETPLCVAEGLLGDADMRETELLLQYAITYWTALRNTSVAGLRGSFLDRRGLLRKEDNGWRMQVERQPFDVLLQHLPWSINVVKLPWMKLPLYTEW